MGKNKFIGWCKRYGPVITVLGAILVILSQIGINMNIPNYYQKLTTEGKILFVGIINFLFTLILFIFLNKNKK